MVELFKLAVQGRKILHTAHEVKTCREAFMRLRGFFEDEQNYPELAEELKYIRSTNGQEAIELKNGGLIRFIARSKSSGRGFSVDDVVCDEAQELNDEQMEVLKPTMAAAPSKNAQLFLTGTPPPDSSFGTVFRRVRADAHDKKDPTICWLEWSVEEMGDIYDKKRWIATNPALGRRISLDFIESETSVLSSEGFARERLGWWSKNTLELLINKDKWNALKTNTPPEDGKLAYGVKFAPDGGIVSLAVCLRPQDRPPYIEVIEHRTTKEGTSWLADWLAQRSKSASAIVIDGASGAFNLIDALIDKGTPKKAIVAPKTSNLADACAMLLELINSQNLEHFDQPLLNQAALGARKRAIGARGAFGFMSEQVDTTPLEACALAYFGAKTSKRNPSRRLTLL